MAQTAQSKLKDNNNNMTKEKFQAYETVRKSGTTNMLDFKQVIAYAKEFDGVELTKEDIIEIMQGREHYSEKYKD